MNITRRIHLNPQSKGSLGKSFEAEFRTAWLDSLGNEDDSKSTLLGLIRRVPLSDVPVHISVCRAQADSLIVQALEQLQVLESLAAAGVRVTFFLFPSEDTESMNNLMDLFYFAGDRVDYVIVHNRAKVRADLFHKSGLEAELFKFGARSLTLPVVTPITLLAIKRAEARLGRKLSFAEVTHPEAGHLEPMLAGEMQWAMQTMFVQYQAAAELLLPPALVPEELTVSKSVERPSKTNQRMLNLGEG